LSKRVGFRVVRQIMVTPGVILVFGLSANSYFDLIGVIWSQEAGSYMNYKTGEIGVFVDTPPSQQGAYMNRV